MSSEVLVSLLHGVEPDPRGLTRLEGSRVWAFPDDYPERLRAALSALNPALAVDALEPSGR